MQQNSRSWDWQQILKNGDFKKTDSVLETGALFGKFALEVAPLVEEVIVTDSYDWADRSFVTVNGGNTVDDWEVHMESVGNISTEKVDMQDIPYQDNFFDKVVCISAIEHVPDDRKAMEEMMRVLKLGGLLLLTTEYDESNPRKVDDPDGSFYRVYDKNGIDRLTQGFQVIKKEIAPRGLEFTTIFLLLQK